MNTQLKKEEVLLVFGSNIKSIRKSKGLTQAEFADHLGITIKSLGSYEEFRAVPSIHALISISNKVGFDEPKFLNIERKLIYDYWFNPNQTLKSLSEKYGFSEKKAGYILTKFIRLKDENRKQILKQVEAIK